MKSTKNIEARFIKEQELRPDLSSYTNFAHAVKSAKFSSRLIRRWFKRLVEKDDYAADEKEQVLKFLFGLSNLPKVKKVKNSTFEFPVLG